MSVRAPGCSVAEVAGQKIARLSRPLRRAQIDKPLGLMHLIIGTTVGPDAGGSFRPAASLESRSSVLRFDDAP